VSKPTVWRWQQAYMNGVVERLLLKDRGKGARRQEAAHCRSTARDRNADGKEKAQASNALERADADFFSELWIDGELERGLGA